MNVCLVYNLTSGKEDFWINAFQNAGIDYKVVQLDKNDWMEQILSEPFDFVIALPNGTILDQKQLFDERVYVINKVLGMPIYPSLNELLVYENKRWLSYWLKSKGIPHPRTDVFYDYDEARNFLDNTEYPVVAKSNIGAAGSGVHILKTKRKALNILNKTFKGNGFPKRRGPNFKKKGVYKRIFSKITDLEYVKKKFKHYKSIQNDLQQNQILFQEYIPHDFELKNVRIGESFFCHKKLVVNDKASGTGKKDFKKPTNNLLNFIKGVSDKLEFSSASFDVFELESGDYLVNEVQTYFGQPLDYLMKINGVPGRYIYENEEWVFEEGNFNTNNSNDLRLKHAIHLYETGQLD